MVEYKISEWQLDKLKEGLENKEDANLNEQCLMIIEAIRMTQPFEMKPIHIPSVWIQSDRLMPEEDFSSSASSVSTYCGEHVDQ